MVAAQPAVQTTPPPANSPPDRVAWKDDGWTIALTLDNGVIADASLHWSDAACDTAFLATLSQSLKGMGLREARDHGVQHACATVQAGHAPAVQGILIPANYSKTSRAAVKALRAAIDAAMPPQPNTWNFEDHGLSDAWRAIPKDARGQRIEVLIADFLGQLGLPNAAIVTDIDQYDRVFIQFQADFAVAQKPPILMQLERHIRQATGERIELFMSEMKDNNRIRRL